MAASATNPLREQFRDLTQQLEVSSFGMWVFLASEMMFFGGLFLWYTVERYLHPGAFAEASHHMSVGLGTVNTMVLICSSLTMVLAVGEAEAGRRAAAGMLLFATLLLGAAFLGIKAVEYSAHIRDHLLPGPSFFYPGPNAQAVEMFFSIYFILTGLHALHLLIGICVVSAIAVGEIFGWFSNVYAGPVEITGLYWHFVDAVWILLYPLLYLIDLHH